MVPKFPKKRASAPPPPQIIVYESTVSNYSEIAMQEAIQKIYAMADEMGGDDPKFMKQRIVDALLTQLNFNNHMILLVGQDLQPSWKETAAVGGIGRSKRAEEEIVIHGTNGAVRPVNNRAENYATDMEWTNFKVENARKPKLSNRSFSVFTLTTATYKPAEMYLNPVATEQECFYQEFIN